MNADRYASLSDTRLAFLLEEMARVVGETHIHRGVLLLEAAQRLRDHADRNENLPCPPR